MLLAAGRLCSVGRFGTCEISVFFTRGRLVKKSDQERAILVGGWLIGKFPTIKSDPSDFHMIPPLL